MTFYALVVSSISEGYLSNDKPLLFKTLDEARDQLLSYVKEETEGDAADNIFNHEMDLEEGWADIIYNDDSYTAYNIYELNI